MGPKYERPLVLCGASDCSGRALGVLALYTYWVALVTVVVSWPLHKGLKIVKVKKRWPLGGCLMALLVFGPLGYIIYLFVGEIHSFITVATTAVERGYPIMVRRRTGLFQRFTDEDGDSWLPGFAREALAARDAWLNDCKQRLAKY